MICVICSNAVAVVASDWQIENKQKWEIINKRKFKYVSKQRTPTLLFFRKNAMKMLWNLSEINKMCHNASSDGETMTVVVAGNWYIYSNLLFMFVATTKTVSEKVPQTAHEVSNSIT